MNSTAPTVGVATRLRLWLFTCLPQHALSRVVFHLTRVRTRLKDPLVRWFIRRYGVDMREAADPDPAAYASFNEFFTRPLRAGARPLPGDDASVVSPVDGRISQIGRITEGAIIQAKGIDYTAAALLGGSDLARDFADGSFATLYLAPGDYHRIHMPLAGRLQQMVHVPGRLYSVAPWTVAGLPGLFTRNERVCTIFSTAHGPLAMAWVGAINVAAIETVWSGLVTPPRGRRIRRTDYTSSTPVELDRGAEAGRFNMGSTVILLLAHGVTWDAGLLPGERVRMGQRLARI